MELVLLSLLVIGFVSGYQVGKEYRYIYDGTVPIAQPDIPAHAVGFAFRCNVIVQPQDDHTHFKVVNFELDTVDKGVANFNTHEFSYRSWASLTEHIEEPFAVKFTNGKFVNLELDKNEPLWSQNMKRALASLFQVDLTEGRSGDPHAREYSTFEESISGNCETLYVLNDDVTDDHEGNFEVTKVRNLENCTYAPRAFYGSFRAKRCQSCGSREAHPLIVNAEVKYKLHGTSANFVVEDAHATASHVFSPLPGGKVIEMHEHRSLHLAAVEEATTDTATSDSLQVHASLAEKQPTSTSLQRREDLRFNNEFLHGYNISLNRQKFLQYFDALADLHFNEDDYKDALHKGSPAQRFMGVYHTFFGLDYNETAGLLKPGWESHPGGEQEEEDQGPERKHEKDRRSLFLDLLSASGNNQHINLFIALVEEFKLTSEEVENFISKLPLHVLEPSEAVLHGVIDLCKLPFVKEREGLKGACLLALASLIEGNCQRADIDDKEDGGFCKPEIVERFYDYNIAPADVRNQSHYLSGVYIEIAGRLATRRAVRQLSRFVGPQVQCPELRQASAWGLVRAGTKHPGLVRHVLLPIFKNTSESHPIRIAAFVGVTATHPDLYLLHHIAREILHDPSDQVASYVTSFFREMAKSKHPCYTDLSRKLEYVLPIWNGVSRFARTPGHTESRFIMTQVYYEEYDYYGDVQTSIIMSEDSYLPLSFHHAKKDCFSGFCYDTLSLTYQGYGVDRLYAAMVSPRPGRKESLWNFFGRRRTPRGAEEHQKLDSSLPITPRDFKPISARFKLNFWGHRIATWDLEETLLDLLRDPSEIGERLAHLFITKLQRAGENKYFSLLPVMVVQVPTDLGLPAFLELKASGFFYVNRHPTTLEHEDNKIRMEFQRHYLMDVYQYAYFGVVLPFDQAHVGAGFEKRVALSLPLHLRATYDLETHKLKLERPLSFPIDLLNYYFKPYAAFGHYNDSISIEDYGLTTTYNEEELTSHNKTYLTDFLGFGYDVKSRLLAGGLRKSLRRFWYDLSFLQKTFYLDVNPHWHPRYLSIHVVPAEKDTTHTIEVDIAYKVYGPNDVERHSSYAPVEGTPGNTTSRVLSVDFVYKGDTKTRTIRAELQVTHTRDLLKHWVRFYYDRSPFSDEELNHTTVCLDTAVTFPAQDWQKFSNLATFYQASTVEAKANLIYGASCSQGSRISLHGTYEHTDADAEEIEDIASGKPPSKNRFKQNILRKLYEICRFYQEQGIPMNYFCNKYLYQSSRLGKLNLDVEYHNLKSPHGPYLLHVLHHHSKKHPDFFSTILSHFRGTDGKLRVVSQVPTQKESHQTTRLVVTTAEGHVFHHDHVPVYTHLLEPRVFHMPGYTNLQECLTTYKHEHCDLQEHRVRTFDGAFTILPNTDCYSVFARDCSPGNHFVILARATDTPTFPKALKVFIADTVIDILPSNEGTGGVLQVNGEVVSVSHDHPYSHVKDDAELFYVNHDGPSFSIHSDTHGIHIVFDGRILLAQVAPFYRGKVCGLCGDYNYDRHNELRGPDNRIYNDTAEFAKSYVVPSDTCTL
ncbi:vitellogenin-1-like [Ornithodoros turicata]|uniref:vitellogenin-1-like n=1 Tax=Ornithodoros turicata TaxID=34597 RepID=UPI0031393E54